MCIKVYQLTSCPRAETQAGAGGVPGDELTTSAHQPRRPLKHSLGDGKFPAPFQCPNLGPETPWGQEGIHPPGRSPFHPLKPSRGLFRVTANRAVWARDTGRGIIAGLAVHLPPSPCLAFESQNELIVFSIGERVECETDTRGFLAKYSIQSSNCSLKCPDPAEFPNPVIC